MISGKGNALAQGQPIVKPLLMRYSSCPLANSWACIRSALGRFGRRFGVGLL